MPIPDAFGSRAAFRSKLRLAAIIVVTALVPVALWAWLALESRVAALETATADQRQVVEAVGEHTLKLLDAQALLLDLIDQVAGERDCQALRSDDRLQAFISLATRKSPGTVSLLILNADGHECMGSMGSGPLQVDDRDRSFREYFKGAQTAGPGQYYVDRAIVGITSGLPIFNVSKPRTKNGTFNGVLLASVNLADLVDYWGKTLDSADQQRVSLLRQDGATIARSWPPLVPPADPAIERRVAAALTAPQGTNRGHSVVDGRPRLGAWRTLPNWNVVVASSVNEDAVLAPWRRSTLIFGLLAMVMSGLLAALAWSLLRERDLLGRAVQERTRKLQQTTALLRAIGNSSPDAIYAKDKAGRFLFANPAVLAVIGKPANEVIGRTDADWHGDADQAAAVMANDRRIIESGHGEVLEETWTAAGQRKRVFRSAKAPLRMEDGTVVGVVAVSSDITPLKDVEARLRGLTEELEARVRAEVAAREDAQARAAHAQRMQALGQLAGGIAHDFNNILQAVQGGAGLIERRADNPASVRRFARTVIEAAERGAAVTRRLLAFARRDDLRAERIDPAGLLDGLRDVLAQTLGSPITVRVQGASGLPAVMADRRQLETVLLNLATNARDAMQAGGTLTLAAAEDEIAAGRVHPAGLKPGRYIRLAVTDTGCGMDQATLDRAAEPFFTTKPQDQGTGLGLPMAKGFAEQSGGALTIESAPGRGTTVTLWLPVAGMRSEAAQVQPGLAPVAGLPRRVLVVDDEDVVRETLVASLEEAGFAVLAAANGVEALALLEAGEAVDALVTDLSMPGMGGLALVHEAHLRRPGLPSVLLTGYAGEAAQLAVSGGRPSGFSLLRKPVSAAQLVDRIEMVLATPTGAAE
nr:hybrid sensor histidine kinase/response regulator [uncultured Rhodopila sp.]